MATYILKYELVIYSSITLNKIIITKHAQKIEWVHDIESYSNTFNFTLPKRLKIKENGNNNFNDLFTDFDANLFTRGDAFTATLYYANSAVEPKTYVGNISQILIHDFTVDILCEDAFYWAKKTNFTISGSTISLNSLANILVEKINNIISTADSKTGFVSGPAIKASPISKELISFNLTNYAFSKVNVIDVLQFLKDNYFMDSYFVTTDAGTFLTIGVNYTTIGQNSIYSPYTVTNTRTFSDPADPNNSVQTITDKIIIRSFYHTFSTYPVDLIKRAQIAQGLTNVNYLKIINMDNLIYKNQEDIRIAIRCRIFYSNDKYQDITAGDLDGEIRTITMNGNGQNLNTTQIQNLINIQLSKLKYTGFQRGSTFVTYGMPAIYPMDLVCFDGVGFIRWYDNNTFNSSKQIVYPKATYLVTGVKTTMDENGFRQEVAISNQIQAVFATSNSISDYIENGKFLSLPNFQDTISISNTITNA